MKSPNRLHKTLLSIFPVLTLLLVDAPTWSVNSSDYLQVIIKFFNPLYNQFNNIGEFNYV